MKKTGKKVKAKKVAVRKPVAKSTPAAQPVPKGDVYAEACKAGSPKVALVKRAGDSHPVQLKDEAHLARLRETHGAGSVEVQS